MIGRTAASKFPVFAITYVNDGHGAVAIEETYFE
jgi:hypothetical protein